MAILDTGNLNRPRKICVYTGVGLLVLAILMFAGVFIGLFEMEAFGILGHSGVRTLASLAVAGCMLAAIGFFNE
jgi:hypothetical protein